MKKKSIIIYIMVIVIILLLQAADLFKAAEYGLQDRVFQTVGRASNNIFVIGIDEETLTELGPFDMWSREKMAEMIELLSSEPETAPAVIAVDVGYFGEKNPEIDKRLAEAVKKAGNVVLTETATFGALADGGTEVVIYERPFESLREAAAGAGHANVSLDFDGVARHATGTLSYAGEDLESFDIKIYREYLKSIGEEFNEKSLGYFGSKGGNYYITYKGMPRAYFGPIGAGSSFSKVLSGEYPASAFKDAIVIIGAYASGMQDNYYTSVDKKTQMYGVEIHANIVNQLIDGTEKKEIDKHWTGIITLLAALISLMFIIIFSPKAAIPLEVLTAAAYFLLIKFLYSRGLVMPVLFPLVIIATLTIFYVTVSYFTVHLEKKRIIADYGKYLSPELAKTIADSGEEMLKLGGTKKDIAVLFVDIRSFTTLSETLPPERVVEMLNSYLKVTTTAIFNNQGTVDKFIGDATMGVFNAPLDLEDYTYRAVCAGIEMAEAGREIDEKLPVDLKGRVGFGVGINCGEAVVGNIGTDFRMEYTAIGDTVNTASRLEGQAKAGTVVISEAVYKRVNDRIECEEIGSVSLKGKTEQIKIYKAIRKL